MLILSSPQHTGTDSGTTALRIYSGKTGLSRQTLPGLLLKGKWTPESQARSMDESCQEPGDAPRVNAKYTYQEDPKGEMFEKKLSVKKLKLKYSTFLKQEKSFP
jgi:hypothetical protein